MMICRRCPVIIIFDITACHSVYATTSSDEEVTDVTRYSELRDLIVDNGNALLEHNS